MAELIAPDIIRESLLAEMDFRRVEATARLDAARRSEMGQFLTPAPIAQFMASLFREAPNVADSRRRGWHRIACGGLREHSLRLGKEAEKN